MAQDDPVTTLKELTLCAARAVVTQPDRVQVEITEGTMMIVIELTVSREDMGRIIGKDGQTANAIRSLLRTSAARMGKRVNLEIGTV